MKQKFYKILSIFLTLVILRGTLPFGAYATTIASVHHKEWSLSTKEELSFWQKFLKIIAKTNSSEKEEESKKEKEKEKEVETLNLRRFLHHLQKELISHQSHEFQVSYYEWLHHAYLAFKAKHFHHLYIYYHKFKIPTSIA